MHMTMKLNTSTTSVGSLLLGGACLKSLAVHEFLSTNCPFIHIRGMAAIFERWRGYVLYKALVKPGVARIVYIYIHC